MIGIILKHPATNNKTVILSEPYEGPQNSLWVLCAEEIAPNKHVIDELNISELIGAEVTKIIKPR